MMKGDRLSAAVLLGLGIGVSLATARTEAAGVNLMCTETRGIYERVTERAGLTTEEVREVISKFWEIPITIDIASGKGSVWGEFRELSVEPDELLLRKTDEEVRPSGHVVTRVLVGISRKTLGFYYYSRRVWSGKTVDGLPISSVSERKSEGVCKKIPVKKENQI